MKKTHLYKRLALNTIVFLSSCFIFACIQDPASTQDPPQASDAGIDASMNCLAAPICALYYDEVPTCEGREHCYENSICGNTIYCLLKDACIGLVQEVENNASGQDGQSEQQGDREAADPGADPGEGAPLPEPSVIETCEAEAVSDRYCDFNEIENRTCFSYMTEDPCFGMMLRYCRPVYPEDLDCAMLLECRAGYVESLACFYGDVSCYTLNTCGGTIFCRM